MGYLIGIAVVVVAMVIVSRLRRRDTVESRELLALAFELFSVVRTQGRAALEAEAENWRSSAIFCQYPLIAANSSVREFLIEALMLLADDVSHDDLDQLLAAASRIARARTPLVGDADRHQRRMFDCIRLSVCALRRGATPVAAVRRGRTELTLNTQPSTRAITRIPV